MKKAKHEPLDSIPELRRELALLRTRTDESAEQFCLGVKARIDEIMHALARGGTPDASHVLPEPRLVKKMVQRLKALTKRETRGRAKDLKRIQDLVSLLNDALVSRQ